MPVLALLLALFAHAPAAAATVDVVAYDEAGRMLDTDAFLRHVARAEFAAEGAPIDRSGLYLYDPEGAPAAGRPWWVATSTTPRWRWSGTERVAVSLPWPVPGDGFSTLILDGDGTGYGDGETIVLNEAAAKGAWRRFREACERRARDFDPPFKPDEGFRKAEARAKADLVAAQAASDGRERGMLFDRALASISSAWHTMIFEHGRQIAKHGHAGKALRYGLTLDESLVDRLSDHAWVADKTAAAGADWVRLVFRTQGDDLLFAKPASFALYDGIVRDLRKRNLHIMGSPLDSALWPRGLTPEAYVERTRNLAAHYKDSIRSWEVASEPNGSWLGGWRTPLPDETVLAAVNAAAAEVKKLDPALETVGTLYWWEGTAHDDVHPLFAWLRWAQPRGFGKDLDVVALSVFPDENPLGLAFDPVFTRLARRFPDKKIMLGSFGFVEGAELKGYWWLEPGAVEEPRKDVVVLFTGEACALPQGIGGGFFFATLEQMLGADKKATPLYALQRMTFKRFQR